ncbi:MAG: type II secretion system F family protein [Clostridia bacterium]|nr:type II secretion system F family protein [Clostridia bacterium]
MPTYNFKAVTKTGLVVKNRVEASSKQSLMKSMKENNITPINVQQVSYTARKRYTPKKQKKNISNIDEIMKNVSTTEINRTPQRTMTTKEKINIYFEQTKKITSRDLVVFTQNFYLLKKADFNNIHALRTLIEGTENVSLRGIIEDILAGVEAGENMYTTMEYYSDVFPYIYVNMIKVGELSGSLTNSLQQAVEYLDDTAKLNKKIKSILIPNIAQFLLLFALLIVGSLVAIPTIQDIFEELGTTEELPALTVAFSDFIKGMITMWYIPLMIIAGIVAAIISYINTPKGKYNFHYFKYKMPIFGKLVFSLDFSRFSKAMLLNLKNGVRIQEALEVSKNVVKNYVMLSMIETSINNILVGTSWIEPFEKSGLCSYMSIEMLKVGMQTDLPEMMDKMVEYMESDIDNTLAKITKTLPQIMYIIVGIVLIFVVLVVLVPCIQVYMGNFLFSAYGV